MTLPQYLHRSFHSLFSVLLTYVGKEVTPLCQYHGTVIEVSFISQHLVRLYFNMASCTLSLEFFLPFFIQ